MIAQIIYCLFIFSVIVNVLVCAFDRRKYKRKYDRERRMVRQAEREQRLQQRHVDRLENRNRELLVKLNEREANKGPVISGVMTSYLDCLGVMASDWQEGDEERLDDLWQDDEENLALQRQFFGRNVALEQVGRARAALARAALRERFAELRQRNNPGDQVRAIAAQEAINRMLEGRDGDNDDFLLFDEDGNEY